MASNAQITTFSFGVEIEILMKLKKHIIQDIENHFHYDAEDMSYYEKRKNRNAIH